jgi:hypothetical protein
MLGSERFFFDLDCKDGKQLRKCTQLYPDYDWYIGFQYTLEIKTNLPEKLSTGQKIQFFKGVCPRLPARSKFTGLYCSNINICVEYCKYYITRFPSEFPVHIVHKLPRKLNPHPPSFQ